MLQKITITCACPDDQYVSVHWGSLFHGVLMQLLPPEIAEEMHQNNIRPFSQYVQPIHSNKSLEWHIGTWNRGVADAFRQILLPLSHVELSHKGIRLEVRRTACDRMTMEEYIASFYISPEPSRRFELTFLTPSTHRSGGEYVLFPSSELILHNLCTRLGYSLEGYSLDDPQALTDLATHIRISRYSLKSASYSLEGIRIPGYIGRVTLSIGGPEPLARLGAMLLNFAEYAGIGVKTSLGMGACKVAVSPKL